MNCIKSLFEEKGIKQTVLAEILGKSYCYVNFDVCNRWQPSSEILLGIAEILDVDPMNRLKVTHENSGVMRKA